MRAALYARVSTSEQSAAMQLRELHEFCDRRAWRVAGEFTDAGVSGTTERRPQLDALLADCRRRKFDAVVVYRYDRFARSLRQLVNALCEFDALGIQFVSLHEGVDTSTPNGRLVFGIFATIAEFERALIADRVKSGMAAAKAKGERIGRPRAVLAGTVREQQILRMRRQGRSWRMIVERLGVSLGSAQRAFLRATEAVPEGSRIEDRKC